MQKMAAPLQTPVLLEKKETETMLKQYEAHRPVSLPDTEPAARIAPRRAVRECRKRGGEEVPFQNGTMAARSTACEGLDPVTVAETCARLHQAIVSQDAAAVAACRARLLASGEPAVANLAQLVNCGATQVEIEALRLLLQIGGSRAHAAAVGKMLALPLHDSSFSAYASVFGDCRDAGVSECLVELLGQTGRADLREKVIAILKTLRGSSVVLDVALAVEAPSDDLHLEDCAGLLAQCRNPSNEEMLERVFRESPTPEVRGLAACSLANIGSPRAVQFLIAGAAREDENSPFCLSAIPMTRSTHAQETLLASAFDQELSSEIRCAAVSSLANQNSSRVVLALQNLVSAEDDAAVQSEMMETINALQSRAASSEGEQTTRENTNEETWF